MLKPMILPEPIAAYFDADKRDVEAIVRCFTDDAVVMDEGHTHTGISAISGGRRRLQPNTPIPASHSPLSSATT